MNEPSPSRRRLLLFAVFACLVLAVGSVRAGTLLFPADGSGIALTLPDGWRSSEDGDILKCTSRDADISFELLPGKIITDAGTDLAAAAKSLAEVAGLTDVKTRDSGEKPNENGVRIAGFIVDGRKDGVQYVGVVSVITPPNGDRCAFQCFGTKDLLLVHSKEMKAVTASFRAAK